MFFFLLWNMAFNNRLFHYLNEKVFFPAFYSGRIGIKNDEVVACIKELKVSEPCLQSWSESTITTTASKYLTLLKKFGLMEGVATKAIRHPYFSDEMFVIFIYWLVASSSVSNIFRSEWLVYGFLERQSFLERLMQKRFAKFFHLFFTGDTLKIETIIDYNLLYGKLYKS